jgi:hypothetical protein
VFGGGATSSPSPFATLGAAKPVPAAAAAPKLTFGGPSSTAPSPFAGLNGQASAFGRPLGGGTFGSALSGPRISTFAKPGDTFKSDKPAKPFGAPESDQEDEGSDDADDDGNGADDASEDGEDKDKADAKSTAEERKKHRLQKSRSQILSMSAWSMANFDRV